MTGVQTCALPICEQKNQSPRKEQPRDIKPAQKPVEAAPAPQAQPKEAKPSLPRDNAPRKDDNSKPAEAKNHIANRLSVDARSGMLTGEVVGWPQLQRYEILGIITY